MLFRQEKKDLTKILRFGTNKQHYLKKKLLLKSMLFGQEKKNSSPKFNFWY